MIKPLKYLLILLAMPIFAEPLTGQFYIEDSSNEYMIKNGELRKITFVLDGESAKTIYKSIKSKAYFDECEGAMKKLLGNFTCHQYTDDTYKCVFGVNFNNQSLVQLEC